MLLSGTLTRSVCCCSMQLYLWLEELDNKPAQWPELGVATIFCNNATGETSPDNLRV